MKKFTLLFILLSFCKFLLAQDSKEFYQHALESKSKDNYTEAWRQLSKALALEPDNELFKAEMADIQYVRKAFYESIPLYEHMLEKDSKNLLYLARLAEMYSMSPQKIKGIEYADRALKLKSNDGQINKMLARTYMEVKHYPKAIMLYQLAEKEFPTDIDIPFNIASCMTSLSKFGDAIPYFEKAIKLDPDNATKIYEAAICCYEANQYKKALEYYQLAEDKGFIKSKVFYENRALTAVEMKNYELALTYYIQAKQFAPYDKELILSISDTYMKKNDFDKSREVLDELLEINPDDAEVIYTKGMTYYKQGNTKKAEPFFNKAFELDPSLKNLRTTKSNF